MHTEQWSLPPGNYMVTGSRYASVPEVIHFLLLTPSIETARDRPTELHGEIEQISTTLQNWSKTPFRIYLLFSLYKFITVVGHVRCSVLHSDSVSNSFSLTPSQRSSSSSVRVVQGLGPCLNILESYVHCCEVTWVLVQNRLYIIIGLLVMISGI